MIDLQRRINEILNEGLRQGVPVDLWDTDLLAYFVMQFDPRIGAVVHEIRATVETWKKEKRDEHPVRHPRRGG